MIQISAKTIVMRLRLRSAADEPRAAPPPPPNMSDRPPPRPLCIRMPATIATIDTTLMISVRNKTTSRTGCEASGSDRPIDSRSIDGPGATT